MSSRRAKKGRGIERHGSSGIPCPDSVGIAAAALFLLSDDARFITGTDLPVDGGYRSMGPEGLGKNVIVAGSR